jgi:hypothetical protein
MLNVHLRITDAATRRPTPVRVRVAAADGTPFPPLGWPADFPTGRNEDVGGRLKLGRDRWWYIDGACEVPLPAGVPLRVQAAKGPEFTPLDETVTLGPGQIAVRLAISRWADARADGWARVDTRCHFLAPHAALLEARAEDLDAANLLAVPFPVLAGDANTYTTTPNLPAFSGQVPAVERDGSSVVVNTFNAHPVLGKVALLNSHRPVFPLAFGGDVTDDWGVCDWCDQCHRKNGLTVWVDAFEPAGGVTGGEALVAAVLGKIDAIEVSHGRRKVPLLPWVYRLWDAGVMVPLVGASGKDSNKAALGDVRTYAEVGIPAPGTATTCWPDAVRAGRTFVTAGPLLALSSNDRTITAAARSRSFFGKIEILADGEVIATQESADGMPFTATVTAACPDATAWVAARCMTVDGVFRASGPMTTPGAVFSAHTSPRLLGSAARNPAAVAAVRKLIGQVCEWAERHGRFANPKRKDALLDRCADAARRLGAAP